MKKRLLVTLVGAMMLVQAPFAYSENVTISKKELMALQQLKSLCSSLSNEGTFATGAAESGGVAITKTAMEPAVGHAVKVASLRGFHSLDKEAKEIEKKKQFKIRGGIKRNWDLQPPSIPHDISKDRITVTGNTCMKCHSKLNFEKEKAPVIAESHYLTRDGKVLDKPSSRRWFCMQCHVPQADVNPLVGNTF